MYLPIQVGKKLCPETNLGFQNDDAGDNISRKNSYYSELTALYWIWKNNPAAYKGLVHYRRFFGTKNFAKRHFSRDRFARIAEHDEVAQILRKTDIILPSKRKYYIETNVIDAIASFRGKMVDTASLGKAFEPDQAFENPDGSPITFDVDYNGACRGKEVLPGPFAEACGEIRVL